MNREFAGNAVLIITINVLVKSFYLFGIDRTVQNILPEGDYGLYFTLFNFAFLFQIISDFGIQNFNARQLSQSRQLLSKYFPYLLSLKLLLGIAFVVFTIGVGFAWGFRDSAVWWLLLGISVNQFLQTFVLFLRSNLAGLGLYRLDSWMSVVDKSLLVIIGGAMLWVPTWRAQFTLVWFVLAHTAAYVLTILLLVYFLAPRLGQLRWRWRPVQLWSFLRQSAPYALVVFLMTAYTRLDAIMIEKLLPNGLLEADRYASAFRLLDAANIGGYLLAGLLLPMFARQLKLGESVRPLTRLAISTIWAGAITLAVSVYLFSTPIMIGLYTDGNAYSGQILAWLMLTFIPMSGGYVYGTLLTANASLRPMNMIFAAGIVLNLILNLILIPRYHALGAAVATFATQTLTFLAQLLLAQKLLELRTNYKLILRIILLAVLLILVERALQFWLPITFWLVKFLLTISAGGVLAFALQLLDIKSWLQWLGVGKENL
ncbi:MAG: polysaccharide biosynthesis C-terminal domain-containing protein [Bacteroidota bacterium]